MGYPDYVPSSDSKFNEWQNVLIAYLASKFSQWSVPQAIMTETNALQSEWNVKFGIVENPATKTAVAVREKNDARKVYEKSLRTMIKAYLSYNPLVTDADRLSMGLPIHSSTRTPVPVPSTIPDVYMVDRNTIRRLTIHFRDSEKTRSGKPAGVAGVLVKWCVANEQPHDIDELNKSALDTRSPFTIEFAENQRGQTAYYALAWQNTKGETGPWSEILSTLVP